MGKRVGLLGYGKIGKAVAADLIRCKENEISFVQDKYYEGEQIFSCPLIRQQEEELLAQTDLVVECVNADVLKEEAIVILKHCDLLAFSLTAFSEEAFLENVKKICSEYGTCVYLPHGAILGLEGIADAGNLLEEVQVETVKPPKALGREDKERCVLYDGPARGACRLYSRNVNVHAGLALAGVGFDKMHSRIIADPSVKENTHHIQARGNGFTFDITVSSTSGSGVTGAYTPYSACGSVRRALGTSGNLRVV